MNGQENSNEIFEGATTAEYWEYDARIVRRWNTDPIPIAWNSPYACFNNNPIYYKDPRGLTAEGDGDKGKGKGQKVDDTPPKMEGYVGPETTVKPKGFWSKVGDFLKGLWNSFVQWDSDLENQKNKNDFTAPDKSKIIKGGQMPTSNNSYNNNSIQASHVNSNPEIVRNDGIFSYMPGSIAGNSEQSGLVSKMGTGTKGVFKYSLSKGKDAVDGANGLFSGGSDIGEAIDGATEDTKPALTNGNSAANQNKTQQIAKQVMSVPEPPVLISYSIPTKDGFTAGTEQATQKNYKQVIKQLEAKGATIDNVDRQLGK